MARVTVEDCLERVPSRFALVIVAAKRTRQLMKGAEPTVRRRNRESVTALREIAKGTVLVQQNVQELLEQAVENYNVMR